jgi:hypothetical protein
MKRHRVLPGTLLGVLLSVAAAGCAEKKSESTAADEMPGTSAGETASSGEGERPVPALKPMRRRMSSDGGASAEAGEPGEGERRGRGRGRGREGMRERFDQNGDGQLDDTERSAMRRARAEQVIARNDSDGDGALSSAEIEGAQGPGRRFLAGLASADANGDGSLSAAEVEAGMQERLQRRRQRRAEQEGQPATGGQAGSEGSGATGTEGGAAEE